MHAELRRAAINSIVSEETGQSHIFKPNHGEWLSAGLPGNRERLLRRRGTVNEAARPLSCTPKQLPMFGKTCIFTEQ